VPLDTAGRAQCFAHTHLPAGPVAFSAAGAIIGPHAVPLDTAGRAQCFARTHLPAGVFGGGAPKPHPSREPLPAPTPRYMGWLAALNVSRAGSGRGSWGGSRLAAPPERKRVRNWSGSAVFAERSAAKPHPAMKKPTMKKRGAANFWWVWEA
jgi:hypothetical protein